MKLTNEQLVELSRPRGEHELYKEQGRRELASVLDAARPYLPPAAPDDPLVHAKNEILRLEAELAEAKKLPIAQASTVPGQMANRQIIAGLDAKLHWARRSLADVEFAEKHRAILRAKEAAPEASFLFEVTAPDGRKLRQEALSAESLRQSLAPGYEVSGRIYPAGYVAPLSQAGPNLLRSLLQAHPEVLLDWLDTNNFVRKSPFSPVQ